MWHENYVAILDLNVNKHHSFRVILTYISFCFLLRVQLSVLQASCLQSWITALRDPPWQLLEMSLSQFLKGGFTPLVPSTFWDTGEVQWVSMNGPSYDSIPISATKHIQPLLWTDKWNLEEGKPKVIDWSIQADWYERNLHWRVLRFHFLMPTILGQTPFFLLEPLMSQWHHYDITHLWHHSHITITSFSTLLHYDVISRTL